MMVPRRIVVAIAVAVLAAVALAAVGTSAYQAGLARGLADSGKLASEAGRYVYPYPGPFWFHGPFFGFGFLFPLLFLVLVFGLFRRPYWGRGCGGWRGGPPPGFDEWHRRAHEEGAVPPRSA
jgi:hypothetical protein